MSYLYEGGTWETATAVTSLRQEMPFKTDHTVYVYRQTFWQKASMWQPQALGTKHSNGAYLVEEADPRLVFPGIYEWDRVWAKVPNRRIESDNTIFTFEEPDDGNTRILRFPKPTVAEIWYDYFYAPNGKQFEIQLYRVKRLKKIAGAVQTIGGGEWTLGGFAISPQLRRDIPLGNGFITIRQIAEDSRLEHWMGDIYCRITKTVRAFSISSTGN